MFAVSYEPQPTNRRLFMRHLAKILLPIAILALAGCDNKGPAEQAGEEIDEAIEDMRNGSEELGNKLDDAMDDIRDTADDVADDIEDGLDDAAEELEKTQ